MANLSELDEWMREIDKTFKNMMGLNKYKIGLATKLFVGEADCWWDLVKPNNKEE